MRRGPLARRSSSGVNEEFINTGGKGTSRRTCKNISLEVNTRKNFQEGGRAKPSRRFM